MPKRKERREMKTKLVAVFMEPSVHERLRVVAFDQRCSVGEVVRRAVADYLGAKQTLRARGKKGAA
jgi:predicted HicB family RNase H-like nuclease